MAGPDRYPVHLALDGQPVLVVGGGAVALRRSRALVACGARVHVVAPEVSDELDAIPDVVVARRPYEPDEAGHYRLVFASTDDPGLNRRVCAEAEAAGVWANDASRVDGGPVAVPAVLRRGSVVMSVGTGGSSPVLAAWLRDQIADLLGPEVAVLAELVADGRQAARSGSAGTPLPDWRPALDSGMLDLIRRGRIPEAKERLSACRSSSSD